MSDALHNAKAALCEFLRTVGKRYHKCTMNSYHASEAGQREAVKALKGYVEHWPEHCARGRGIVLFGPPGTGKDHLLIATARLIMETHPVRARWVRGEELWSDARERIRAEQSEKDFVREFAGGDLLVLSDPVPPSGRLSDYQASVLFRIVDTRYHRLKPTWVTLNVRHRAEADERMGSQVCDRLRDEALVIYCPWSSYRKPVQAINSTSGGMTQ